MNEHTTSRQGRMGAVRGTIVLAALLAGLVVVAPPALAETFCLQDATSIVVHLDETNPGDETLIEVIGGLLHVNGDLCGTGVSGSIAIVDVGDPKVDRVRLNLGAGAFRMNGAPVFVNLILDQSAPNGARDEVTIRGTSAADFVSVEPGIVLVDRFVPYTGIDRRRLLMGIGFSEDVKFYFLLRGGDDVFQMNRDSNGDHYSGFMSVRGGSGKDDLFGGPGRQRLRGGKGADRIEGKAGADLIWGNSGADFIKGGSGADEIYGGKGVDDVRAGPGADIMHMRDGRVDDVHGKKGRDVCFCDSNDNLRSASRG